MLLKSVRYIWILCTIILIGFFAISGCGEIKQAPVALFDNLLSNDRFVFEEYDWNMKKDEFLKKSTLSEEDFQPYSDEYRLVLNKNISIDIPKLIAVQVYTFSDDMFLRGAYYCTFESKEEFIKTCIELKEYIKNENLLIPLFAGSIDILGTIPNLSGSGRSVRWDASDGSILEISIHNNTKYFAEKPHYLLYITTRSPRSMPIRKDLK